MNRWLRLGSLLAAVALCASAEYDLAHWGRWPLAVAWLAPVAVDLYVIAALRTRRDRGPALGLMALTVSSSHVLPVLWPRPPAQCLAVVALVPVYVLWRVHAVTEDEAPVVVAVDGVNSSIHHPVVEVPVEVSPAPTVRQIRSGVGAAASHRPAKVTRRVSPDRRAEALRMHRSDPSLSAAEIGRRLGVTRQQASRYLAADLRNVPEEVSV